MKIAGKEDIFYINQKSYGKSIFNVQMCGITYPDKNYEIERSNSHIVCIEYVESGSGTVSISGDTFHPSAGDVYILPRGLDHHYYADSDNPWKKVFINIQGALIENLIAGYQIDNRYHFENLNIKEEMYRIISVAKENSDSCTEEIICVINRIFLKMREHVYEKRAVSEIAEKMKDFLNTKITEKFRMDELCDFVSRSESQTIRIFKDAYFVTPYAYVLNRKISLAKDMLINTSLSVKQIAYRLNFSDEYYFSNVFKSKTGHSPTSYRKIK